MTRKISFSASFLLVFALLVLGNPVAADNYKCSDTVAGSFTSTLDGGPTCASPIGVCTTGILTFATGNAEGDYSAVICTRKKSN